MLNRFPWWLKRSYIPENTEVRQIKAVIKGLSLNTVCLGAHCPNTSECFSHRNLSFLILGEVCTRRCTFCNIKRGSPQDIDLSEPNRIVEAAKKLSLKHIVITSVTRDDLDDGGAYQFINVVKFLKKEVTNITIEVLTPDFKGEKEIIISVANSGTDIFAHNIDTIPRLYRAIKPQSDYCKSLKVLEIARKRKEIHIKSGIMLGMGEKKREIEMVMQDLRGAGCDILTIGQYLRPNKRKKKIDEFIHPDEFKDYKQKALDMGFTFVASGPFVRSSHYESRE